MQRIRPGRMMMLIVFATAVSACSPAEVAPEPTPSSSATSTTSASTTTAPLTTTEAPSTTSTPTTLPPWVVPKHPIQIVDGAFIDSNNGQPFVVRGANYLTRIDLGTSWQNRTLSPAVFDRTTVAADFVALAERGYNTVRVFIDSCNGGRSCIANPGGPGLNPAYLDTIVEFMELAQENGIFILFTSNDLPDDAGYWEISSRDDAGVFPGYRNTHYMTASGERAAEIYWTDLLTGLIDRRAPFEVVLGWSILNEQWMFKDQYPLTPDAGIVTTKTGTYDTSDPEQKRAMVVDGVRSYIAAVARIIRSYDPNGLVTMGFFAPQFPNATGIGGDWYVDTAPLVESSALDFFDFHAYPGEDIPLVQISENFGLPADKPVIMGEVGAFIDRFPDIEDAAIRVQQWIADSCALGFAGWLYWEMLPADLSVGDATWALTASENYLLDALAPRNQPNACVSTLSDPNIALGATVRASRSLPEEPPENAVDGNPNTQWGAGTDAPQWIEIDLGQPSEIGTLRLRVAQFPAGRTVHVITVDGTEITRIDSTTAGGQVLNVPLSVPITGQVVRITTTVSPSWVAWSEIEILAP